MTSNNYGKIGKNYNRLSDRWLCLFPNNLSFPLSGKGPIATLRAEAHSSSAGVCCSEWWVRTEYGSELGCKQTQLCMTSKHVNMWCYNAYYVFVYCEQTSTTTTTYINPSNRHGLPLLLYIICTLVYYSIGYITWVQKTGYNWLQPVFQQFSNVFEVS